MTDNEVGNFIVLLLIAGNETTTNLIGNAVLALLNHPEALQAVRQDPSLVPVLVEEALRFDSPVQLMLRHATEDVELSGGKVRQGELVAMLLGSANRDEQQFPEPERFDLHRVERAHLAFGFGTHFCLGAHLARLEATAALDVLLNRFQDFELSQVQRVPSLLMRGVKSLRLRPM